VFGVPDERLGEVPAAVVYCEDDRGSTPRRCAPSSPANRQFKMPAYIWVHDEPLPKLGTGKIDKDASGKVFGEVSPP
jgi:long-chain acyl-CoA synthetase